MELLTASFDGWKVWDNNGRAEFISRCKQIFDNDSESVVLNYLIHELFTKTFKNVLKREQFIATVKELIKFNLQFSLIIVDVLSVADGEFSDEEERKFLYELINDLEKVTSKLLLKERLEIDTLQEAGILSDKTFSAKFIKVKTKLYYKQKKFNLLREESEGYSKLIVELNHESIETCKPQITLNVITSLIGCFNLDPNRVLDIILESFERRPKYFTFFIELISSYMNDAKIISEILGFKFRYYHTDCEQPAPKSLYLITALLLQYGVIELDDIYVWLVPDDLSLWNERQKSMADAKEYVRKLHVVSLKDKDKEKDKDKDDVFDEKDNDVDRYGLNQKFRLCEAMFEIGDWDHALVLINRLPHHLAMDQEPIALKFCQLIHWILMTLCNKHFKVTKKSTKSQYDFLKNSKAIQPVEEFIDLRTHVIPMLEVLGPSIHYDPILIFKIIRLCKVILDQNENHESHESLYYDILTIVDTSLLPSLSYMDCNCCLAEELWNIIKSYPYSHRYSLYSRWKNDVYQNHPRLIRKRGDAQKQIKNIMKRVSKENVKPVGRLIGKLTHSSPGVLFDYVLLQIQIYDNLIAPVIDSLKYLTSLSYDVLGYCLIESLVKDEKNRFKHDGTSISMWLQNLSSFSGAIFKKYNIELTGLLQFVANQLKAKKSSDLLILKEIVTKMTGIEVAEELTMDQLNAMAGGELLKAEAGYFSQVRNTKKSSLRLKEAMSDHDLIVTLCLLIAQQKYCVVYCENENSHLKLVGKLFDHCQDTLVQFGNFLGSTLSVDEYVSRLPPIHDMLLEYHIHMDVGFFLARPMLTHAINTKFDQMKKAESNFKKLSTSVVQQKYYEITSEVMNPVVESVIPLHTIKIWEDISPQFLVTFWSLVMYDLFVPVQSYNKEINKIKQLALQALDNKELTSSKTKKEQERYNTLIEKLQDEKKKQQEHVDRVLYRLKQEKDTWFPSRSVKSAKNETITQFLQLCLFPRCIFTAIDAVYCSCFVHTIHILKTANFSTLLCYDRLFCNITYSVTCCTENEANRYGRFLCLMLETVMKWHSSKTIFDKECANYPGFVTKYRVSNHYTEACDHVGYENYRHVCHKWHYKIAKALITCLDSKEYVQIRNALIILIKILPHFPLLLKLNQIIERKIEKLREEEKSKRQDLFVLATSYVGLLKNRSTCAVKEADFHLVNDKNLVAQAQALAVAQAQSQRSNESAVNNTAEKSEVNGSKHNDLSKDKLKDKDNKSREKKSTPVTSSKSVTKSSQLNNSDSTKYEKSSKDSTESSRKDEGNKKDEITDHDSKKRDKKEHKDDKHLDTSNSSKEEVNGVHSDDKESSRRNQDGEHERDIKRRKVESTAISTKNATSSSSSSSLTNQVSESIKRHDDSSTKSTTESPSSASSIDKKDKNSSGRSSKDREVKKDRKIVRKRDRLEESSIVELKRRKEEERGATSKQQNGDSSEVSHLRDKHRSNRDDKSPQVRDTRDRFYDHDTRDKQYPFIKKSR